jgi:dihydrofolate reductase
MAQAIEAVVAVSENDVIGRDNRLPWHLPADLRRFKELTTGRYILMGRKTHQSIGKALPNRVNLVLTRSPRFVAEDCVIVGSVAVACAVAAGAAPGGLPLMVIGGAEVYRQCLPMLTRIHLTVVHAQIADGDAFFSAWRDAEWRETARERLDADANNAYALSFVTLERAGSNGG